MAVIGGAVAAIARTEQQAAIAIVDKGQRARRTGYGRDLRLDAQRAEHMLCAAPQRQPRADFGQFARGFVHADRQPALRAGNGAGHPAKPRADDANDQRFSSTSSYQVII